MSNPVMPILKLISYISFDMSGTEIKSGSTGLFPGALKSDTPVQHRNMKLTLTLTLTQPIIGFRNHHQYSTTVETLVRSKIDLGRGPSLVRYALVRGPQFSADHIACPGFIYSPLSPSRINHRFSESPTIFVLETRTRSKLYYSSQSWSLISAVPFSAGSQFSA